LAQQFGAVVGVRRRTASDWLSVGHAVQNCRAGYHKYLNVYTWTYARTSSCLFYCSPSIHQGLNCLTSVDRGNRGLSTVLSWSHFVAPGFRKPSEAVGSLSYEEGLGRYRFAHGKLRRPSRQNVPDLQAHVMLTFAGVVVLCSALVACPCDWGFPHPASFA
jgi:hypothetical protein